MKYGSVRNICGVFAVSMLLSACGGEDTSEIDRVTKLYDLKAPEVAAMQACATLSDEKKPIVRVGNDNMRMSFVPLDICGCQAPILTAVFQDEKYGSYAAFLKYIGKPVRRGSATLKAKELKPGIDLKYGTYKLTQGLEVCVFKMVHGEPKLAKKVLTPYEDPKTKKKNAKTKTAEKAKPAG